MSDSDPSAKSKTVHCRRVDAPKTLDEHASCPYCFGKRAQIASEDHQRFCSYDPEVDPIIYGFPPGTERSR